MMPRPTAKWPVRLRETYDAILTALDGQKDREDLAYRVLTSLCENVLGGTQEYFPKADVLLRQMRDMRILAEFTGSNQNELARKHGVSPRHVYNVAAQHRKAERGSE